MKRAGVGPGVRKHVSAWQPEASCPSWLPPAQVRQSPQAPPSVLALSVGQAGQFLVSWPLTCCVILGKLLASSRSHLSPWDEIHGGDFCPVLPVFLLEDVSEGSLSSSIH